jgi:hypothetical protein
MPRYNCSLRGQCEQGLSLGGTYASLEECRGQCTGLDTEIDREIAYTVMEYNPEQALRASTSDQRVLIQHMTGVHLRDLPDNNVIPLLIALQVNDWLSIYRIPELNDYIAEWLDEFELVVLEMTASINFIPSFVIDFKACVYKSLAIIQPALSGYTDHLINRYIDSSPQSLEGLIHDLQQEIGGVFVNGLTGQSSRDYINMFLPVVQKHWLLILDVLNDGVVPFQDLIRP